RASSSISSVMSRPVALPVGPTRLAEMRTSAPAPEPRSRTVSPSCRSATAVGTPHPSDALIAPSGTSAPVASSYRLLPNTPVASAGLQDAPEPPQQPAASEEGSAPAAPLAAAA